LRDSESLLVREHDHRIGSIQETTAGPFFGDVNTTVAPGTGRFAESITRNVIGLAACRETLLNAPPPSTSTIFKPDWVCPAIAEPKATKDKNSVDKTVGPALHFVLIDASKTGGHRPPLQDIASSVPAA
jgi:hypothetical protein